MEGRIVSMLLLMVAAETSAQNRFFISAPTVFHRGVSEKVVVQMGSPHLGHAVTLYLEDETSGAVVSARETVACATEKEIKTVQLMINWEAWSSLSKKNQPPYLLLVAESASFSIRQITKVLVSKHRGYIFIQTNQPVYNPTQQVSYRIYTLDHYLKPHEEAFYLSVYNADGNRVLKILRSGQGGIYRGMFSIPSVSRTGTWKIVVHYEDDEASAASREFSVEKFILPSFDVNIDMEQKYILLTDEELIFTISAMYTYGEKVKGAYHCQFGVATKDENNKMRHEFIKGLEVAGSVQDGKAVISVRSAEINSKLRDYVKKNLTELRTKGEKLYVKVFVTNIQSGEIQEADVYLPVFSQKYTVDLSRTRSHFVPGFPLEVAVSLHLQDGSPAADVNLNIELQASSRQTVRVVTDQEGAASATFNFVANGPEITVQVSADGLQATRVIRSLSSQSSSYLYMTFTNKIYSASDVLSVTYNTRNAPTNGYIYYMVLSRGIVVTQGSIGIGTSVKQNLQITADMVPSFRLIGYFHGQGGAIIADSAWVDVRDECKIKVKVSQEGKSKPGKQSTLHIDLHGERATVALLAVDKAFYALNADNKLTSKQVFSSMKSYDLGCSYGGGSDSWSALVDAGLSFVSQGKSDYRKDFSCNPERARHGRSIDLQMERMSLKSSFNDTHLQDCCLQGFSLLPMERTCEQRTARVLLVGGTRDCADVFLKCCNDGERLRRKKMREDAQNGFDRTSTVEDIEQFFLGTANQYIRRYFPPSFEFKDFNVNGKIRHSLRLPDSITTWEIQVVTISAATGFCVVKPIDVKVFQTSFVSLRLPYSVKKYEQLSISPVVYNYGDEALEVAVNMEQTEGLCSPGSATTTSFVNITVEPHSSQFVSFSAVPMITGSIPIKIRLYDMEQEWGVDAIEKFLSVQSEGLQKQVEKTQVIKLDGRSSKNITLDGTLPDETVPDSSANIFISMEGDGFGNSYAKKLLSPEMVAKLIQLPNGCVEQTMGNLVPTALAIRYLDLSEQWFELPPGKRDKALDELEHGFMRIVGLRGKNGAYVIFKGVAYSNWMTAYIVKVLSLVAQRQNAMTGQQGRRGRVVPLEGIRKPVQYLLSVQKSDGSFSDPQPVLHRGVLSGIDQDASMTAFITIALKRSLEFLETEGRTNAENAISRSTSYLMSQTDRLQHPYAVAITAHCLSICLPKEADLSAIWTKLQAMATKAENGCYHWTADRGNRESSSDAITVETTAFVLLTAVELGHTKWADETACWLTAQENYFGGYWSTQDTMVALEALAEYALKRLIRPEARITAEFTTPLKHNVITLELENRKDKVETDLKKFTGGQINVQLTGEGEAKLKMLKTFHVLEPKDDCAQLSIRVTVTGKVKYTAKVVENYDYYYYDAEEQKQGQVPQSAIELFDARTRNRRDLYDELNQENTVTYKVCVSLSRKSSLTGMAIADITLLSGFEADIHDLDMLKQPHEQYITHYEVSYGRVLIYFNELFERDLCIEFDAEQKVPVGLLQPAPAVFYDYYEPSRRCTVFYSAPQRSKLVSKLCSGDVCQCAERPCHKLQETFKLHRNRRLTKNDRAQHACFSPTVDYAYIVKVLSVSVKSNFELYRTNVTEVLRSNLLMDDNSIRVFVVRLHCKARLELGKSYLLMGKEGLTTDSDGAMQYLLESNTWVEKVPSAEECKKSNHRATCRSFYEFIDEYKTDGCRQ
ncbi:complement C4-B [Salarias fasciatus]|uniref:complement C4-B n=1 Tax=Salarias fasciatus TaxID=181472 RepID=UPI001176867B|nr:complement C4-B-like [Salarias fasciatus]